MILFPNCKINLGLNIVSRRPDGYHDIETVMYPVAWTDVLEIVPGKTPETRLFTSGRPVDCPPEKNLVMKAYRLLEKEYGLSPVDIYLHKVIPDGAGLGGGSSDAAFTLKGLNEMFDLGLSDEVLARYASRLGADCAFFIYNRPMLCTGIGDVMKPVELDLRNWRLVLAKPAKSVSTAEAYSLVHPSRPAVDLVDSLRCPVEEWAGVVKNDFEPSVEMLVPEIAVLKSKMIMEGAAYTSMSGSGSAVFGIFPTDILADCERFGTPDCYIGSNKADWQYF